VNSAGVTTTGANEIASPCGRSAARRASLAPGEQLVHSQPVAARHGAYRLARKQGAESGVLRPATPDDGPRR
jgi:hypothetical protein